MKLLAVVLFGIVLALVFVLVRRDAEDLAAFRAKAAIVKGEITALDEQVIDQKNHRKQTQVSYRYAGANGQMHDNTEIVEFMELCPHLSVGQPVDVYVLPGAPVRAHLALLLDYRLGAAGK